MVNSHCLSKPSPKDFVELNNSERARCYVDAVAQDGMVFQSAAYGWVSFAPILG